MGDELKTRVNLKNKSTNDYIRVDFFFCTVTTHMNMWMNWWKFKISLPKMYFWCLHSIKISHKWDLNSVAIGSVILWKSFETDLEQKPEPNFVDQCLHLRCFFKQGNENCKTIEVKMETKWRNQFEKRYDVMNKTSEFLNVFFFLFASSNFSNRYSGSLASQINCYRVRTDQQAAVALHTILNA